MATKIFLKYIFIYWDQFFFKIDKYNIFVLQHICCIFEKILLSSNNQLKTQNMENQERKKRFDSYISTKALEGYIVVDKNSESLIAVLKKEGTKLNNTLHGIITLVTCGSWGIVWLILFLKNKKESRIRVSIDDSGNLLEEEVKQ